MDRGAWQARVHGVIKELDMTEQLNSSNIRLTHFFQHWQMGFFFFGFKETGMEVWLAMRNFPLTLRGPANLGRLTSLSMKSKEPSRSEEPESCLGAFVINPSGSQSCRALESWGPLLILLPRLYPVSSERARAPAEKPLRSSSGTPGSCGIMGCLLEMQNLKPHPRPTDSAPLSWSLAICGLTYPPGDPDSQ